MTLSSVPARKAQTDKQPKPSSGRLATYVLAATAALLTAGAGWLAYEYQRVPSLEDPQAAKIPAATADEIPNFSAVHPYLFRGSMPTAYGILYLKKQGVKTIIDLRESKLKGVQNEAKCAKRWNINYINLPMVSTPTTDEVKQYIEVVSYAAEHPDAAPVFVHCAYGADRTGMMTAIWRVQHDGWNPMTAFAEMLRHGFLIHKLDKESKTKAAFDPKNWPDAKSIEEERQQKSSN